jgi:hypothetical protein
MERIVNLPQVAEFRQTLNVYTKQWTIPKRRVTRAGKDVWRNIDNVDSVITKSRGIECALWRLRWKILTKKDENKKQKWNCTEIIKAKRGIYSVFYFKCTRMHHSISGVY